MEANSQNKTHPLIITAAVAVTALSLAGLGAIFGLIPTAGSKQAPPPALESAVPAASTAISAPVIAAAEPPATRPERSEPAARAKPQPTPAAQRPNQSRVAQEAPKNVYAERADGEQASARRVAVCKDCGTIASVREVRKEGEGSGVGAVAGGVLGGVVGNQMGKGGGKDAMTVLGALGGAYAGHQIEKTQRASQEYEVTVRYNDGTTQTFKQATAPAWREGDRVRVRSGEITAAD